MGKEIIHLQHKAYAHERHKRKRDKQHTTTHTIYKKVRAANIDQPNRRKDIRFIAL